MILIQILVATFVISLIALVGVLVFPLKGKWFSRALEVLVALSAGALLGGAFLHLLPEAIAEGGAGLDIFLYLLLGFCMFFILEQFLRWHHQHGEEQTVEPFSYLILVSDAVHNFVDGLAIAASFVVSYPTGIATTLAVALHEIPQEFGNFGVLIHGGMRRRQALTFNYIAQAMAILGGIVGYYVSSMMHYSIVYILPFAAGNFIYIAAADLIPEIKHRTDLRWSIIHFCVFLAGIGIMLVI
ncbi:MAG: zinc/iron permease [Dehalococcoidia bacterium]|nr:zinc/iron permease [Dehalococcoidia bacterium]